VLSYRERGEAAHREADEHTAHADTLPMNDPDELHILGWAQVQLLQAVYAELRHGNDQAAAAPAGPDKGARTAA
jgi:hypothetical protein